MFKVEDLEEALFRLGHLNERNLIFILWGDTTEDCKPVARVIRITFPKNIKDETARDIIRGINAKVWILSIVDDHQNVYQMTKAEEFAKKTCEAKVKKLVKSKKEVEDKNVGKRKTSSS